MLRLTMIPQVQSEYLKASQVKMLRKRHDVRRIRAAVPSVKEDRHTRHLAAAAIMWDRVKSEQTHTVAALDELLPRGGHDFAAVPSSTWTRPGYGWENRLQMWVTQPAWRQEVLSDATRVRIANNCASIGHAVLLFARSRIYVRRDRVVQTRFTYTLQVKRASASNAPTFKYRDSYEAMSFGRLRRARNFKTLLRNRSSEHNRRCSKSAHRDVPSPRRVHTARVHRVAVR